MGKPKMERLLENIIPFYTSVCVCVCVNESVHGGGAVLELKIDSFLAKRIMFLYVFGLVCYTMLL